MFVHMSLMPHYPTKERKRLCYLQAVWRNNE